MQDSVAYSTNGSVLGKGILASKVDLKLSDIWSFLLPA